MIVGILIGTWVTCNFAFSNVTISFFLLLPDDDDDDVVDNDTSHTAREMAVHLIPVALFLPNDTVAATLPSSNLDEWITLSGS